MNLKNILVVDRQVQNNRMLIQYLESFIPHRLGIPACVSHATDPKQGLRLFQESPEKFDVVLIAHCGESNAEKISGEIIDMVQKMLDAGQKPFTLVAMSSMEHLRDQLRQAGCKLACDRKPTNVLDQVVQALDLSH